MANKQKSDESALATLEGRVNELTEALQRERADAINLRRRMEEERTSLASYYKTQFVRELLPVLDNLELAILHTPNDLSNHPYIKGVQSVMKQFGDILASMGIEKIKAVGEKFDPRFHEAVHLEDSEGEDEVVLEEVQSGWMMGDEVIRPASVKVAKLPKK